MFSTNHYKSCYKSKCVQAADQLKLTWFPETVQSMKPTWAYVCIYIMIIRLLSHVSIGK